MLRKPDARAGGISVTFTTAKARKSDQRAPGSKSAAADESDDAKLSTMARKASEAEAAAPFDPSPAATATTTTKESASAASSSSSSSHSLLASAASSIGVYAGFYWWILVITAGIGPTLWSTMALAFHLGDCPAAWLCLAASGVYWVSFSSFLLFTLSCFALELEELLERYCSIEGKEERVFFFFFKNKRRGY